MVTMSFGRDRGCRPVPSRKKAPRGELSSEVPRTKEGAMKRTLLVLVLVLGMVAASMTTADAQKKKKKKKPPAPARVERTIEFDYECPCVGLFQLGGLTGGTNIGGGPFTIGADDLFLTATAEDTTGQAVPVEVQQDDGTGANKATGSFCTETEEPIALDLGMEVRIFVGDPLVCGTPSVLAGGTITFTLSNLP